MSSLRDFKVGDLVLCLEPGAFEGYHPQPNLIRGRAYKITEINSDCFYLKGIMDGGFYWRRFIKLTDVCIGTLGREEAE